MVLSAKNIPEKKIPEYQILLLFLYIYTGPGTWFLCPWLEYLNVIIRHIKKNIST